MSNTNLCLANPNGWAKMEECSDKTTQNFSYVSSSREIKYGLKCLDYNSDTTLVFIHDCHGDKNQKWYYNYKTMELKTLKDEKCLDMPGSREMYMSPCHGGLNQKFQIPSDWQMLPLSVSCIDFLTCLVSNGIDKYFPYV